MPKKKYDIIDKKNNITFSFYGEDDLSVDEVREHAQLARQVELDKRTDPNLGGGTAIQRFGVNVPQPDSYAGRMMTSAIEPLAPEAPSGQEYIETMQRGNEAAIMNPDLRRDMVPNDPMSNTLYGSALDVYNEFLRPMTSPVGLATLGVGGMIKPGMKAAQLGLKALGGAYSAMTAPQVTKAWGDVFAGPGTYEGETVGPRAETIPTAMKETGNALLGLLPFLQKTPTKGVSGNDPLGNAPMEGEVVFPPDTPPPGGPPMRAALPAPPPQPPPRVARAMLQPAPASTMEQPGQVIRPQSNPMLEGNLRALEGEVEVPGRYPPATPRQLPIESESTLRGEQSARNRMIEQEVADINQRPLESFGPQGQIQLPPSSLPPRKVRSPRRSKIEQQTEVEPSVERKVEPPAKDVGKVPTTEAKTVSAPGEEKIGDFTIRPSSTGYDLLDVHGKTIYSADTPKSLRAVANRRIRQAQEEAAIDKEYDDLDEFGDRKSEKGAIKLGEEGGDVKDILGDILPTNIKLDDGTELKYKSTDDWGEGIGKMHSYDVVKSPNESYVGSTLNVKVGQNPREVLQQKVSKTMEEVASRKPKEGL